MFGSGLLLSEGDAWKRQRRLLNPGFAAARIDGYARTMRERTAAAVARWPERGVLDAAAEMARLRLDVAVRTLFGADIPDGDARRVADAFSAVSDFYASPLALLPVEVPRWLPLPILRRHARAVVERDAVVHELVSRRRAADRRISRLRYVLPRNWTTIMACGSGRSTSSPPSRSRRRPCPAASTPKSTRAGSRNFSPAGPFMTGEE